MTRLWSSTPVQEPAGLYPGNTVDRCIVFLFFLFVFMSGTSKFWISHFDPFTFFEQDATVEWVTATLQLKSPPGDGVGPRAALPASSGWYVLNRSSTSCSFVFSPLSTSVCALSPRQAARKGWNNFILSQWKDVNQCRLAVGSLNWSEHVCQVSSHWVPFAKGNAIALQAYGNDSQPLRTSPVMNSYR